MILLSVITGTIFISACTSLSDLESRKEKLLTKKGYMVAEAYIDSCKIHDMTLLSINLSLLNTSLSDNPELKELRTKIDSSIVNIRNYLMSVDRYRNLMEYADKNGIRNREFNRSQRLILDSLSRASDEYSEMRKASITLIKENNLKILTLIVADYKKRGEAIPLDWVPGNMMAAILQNPDILKMDKKIEKIDRTILEKYGNKEGLITLNEKFCY
jgi:hypothetical protein